MDTGRRWCSVEETPLVLGTAQLGMAYGIANTSGKPDPNEAVHIVRTARQSGIRFFDTAQAYGDSEEVLGKCFRTLGFRDGECRVVSKLDPNLDLHDPAGVFGRLERSMRHLGIGRFWGLLTHRESLLDHDKDVVREIGRQLKVRGLTEHFGVSVYSPEKGLEALELDEVDIVQLPFNVFDQRALETDLFRTASKRGKGVFVRSVYLQGLLLLEPEETPPELAFAVEPVGAFHRICRECGLAPKLLALAFVVQRASGARIVIGAEKPDQVRENAALYDMGRKLNLPDLACLSQGDSRLINPSLWYR
ncbi:MAG: aldo/keto reductase [Thermodesulfobacteriota bacterium]